ncbi:unnamed protein product [Paramecium sonneborni]|uniref:Uncharacterized protein n=1 Tax=Paramecium sonneborni TaxID=65129 RepID=A0A8S1QBX9_9CILI|nr:unnamed protein product [Paramecium sonneborni]
MKIRKKELQTTKILMIKRQLDINQNPQQMQVSPDQPITTIPTRPSLLKIEIFIELCTLILFIYTCYEFFFEYQKLPSTIDIDFGSRSSFKQVNKQYLIIILVGAILLQILISSLQLFTHKFKYRVAINSKNCHLVFRYKRQFLSFEKLITMGLFMYDTISIFKIIQKQWQPLALYLSALFILPYIICWIIYNKMINQLVKKETK